MDTLLEQVLKRASQVRGQTATMMGRVLFENRGIQTVATDSRIHPVVKCCGPNYIRGARPGDRVQLAYRIGPGAAYGLWFGRVV